MAQFRRLLRQEGAFLHQDAVYIPSKPIAWWIDGILEQVTNQSHIQLRLERYLTPTEHTCTLNHQKIRLGRTLPITLQALHQALLRVVSREPMNIGDTVARKPSVVTCCYGTHASALRVQQSESTPSL